MLDDQTAWFMVTQHGRYLKRGIAKILPVTEKHGDSCMLLLSETGSLHENRALLE